MTSYVMPLNSKPLNQEYRNIATLCFKPGTRNVLRKSNKIKFVMSCHESKKIYILKRKTSFPFILKRLSNKQ